MPKQPLAEVFGFPPDNLSPEAERYRRNRLCPYNNKVPSCTKDKANDPLGVCSVFEGNEIAITCPIRFRQDWLIAEDAAFFFFPENTTWTSLTEIRLNDKNGMSAGNIDVVLVAYNDRGRIIDFGALEIQAVYISGNVRQPFEYYMEDPSNRSNMDWAGQKNYPRPDYLSSSRKRLAPQLIYKGGILKNWNKKQAVALHKGFFNRLPTLPEVDKAEADIAWLIYDLKHNPETNSYHLSRSRTVYTQFYPALEMITIPETGAIEDFIGHLQSKLDERLDNPPDAPSLLDIL
ncbi:NotI family restriction endonuclease [Aerosakkonema sp. BLCC-F183]|uniref:NotI family restriction endonuclease n=1 Tax=Aerosakkonema sp. BLCC-F183 TaxID=3342834 RepID=UPI0035BA4474